MTSSQRGLSAILLVLLSATAGWAQQRDPAEVFNRGMEAYNAGDLRRARRQFLLAAEAYRHGESLYRLYSLSWAGLAAQGMEQYELAVDDYEAALGLAESHENGDEGARLRSGV